MNDLTITQVGVNIKTIRRMRGLSQTELSLLVGHKSPAWLSWVEQGERVINIEDLIILARVLKVPINKLFLPPHDEIS